MKTFYTERDIVDLHAAGLTELEVNDDVVLTDLAREKVETLGIQLIKTVEKRHSQAERLLRALGAHLPPGKPGPAGATPSPSLPPGDANGVDPELVSRIKAGVIARLGTGEYSDLLDQVIPQVLARLKK